MALSEARPQSVGAGPPEGVPASDVAATRPAELPRWLLGLIAAAVGAVLGGGGVGLLTADLGHYSFPAALIVGIVGAVLGLGTVLRYRSDSAPAARSDTWAAAAMTVVAAGLAAWNAMHTARHVVVDSDPGVYAETGKWIATHGTLTVPYSTVWGTGGAAASSGSAGVYPHPGNTVQFQFVHMVGALLAGADRIGGDPLMFRVPALLGSLGLLVIYCVGRLIVRRPWPVVAAVTAFGVSLPQLQVSRDTFSETTSQFLIWTALLLILLAVDGRARRGRYPVALAGGLALGGTFMAHVDAPAFFIFLPFVAVAGWVGADAERRRMLVRVYGLVVLGAVAPVVLGTLDLQRRSGGYYPSLHGKIFGLYGATVGVLVVSLVLALGWIRWRAAREWVQGRRAVLGNIAGGVVAVGLLLAWTVRPLMHQHASGAALPPQLAVLARLEGLPSDPTRSYTEQSMVWISWYMGPVATVLAVAGVAVLVRRLVRAPAAAEFITLAVTGTLTAIYLWSPSITETQLWASRRYVTTSLPLLYIAAAAALVVGMRWAVERLGERNWSPAVFAGGAAGLLLFPLAATWPLRDMSTESAALSGLEQVCHAVGPNAAVLYATGGYPVVGTTRAWCGDPAAYLVTPATPAQIQAQAAAWKAQGRTLWVLGLTSADVSSLIPGARPGLVANSVSPDTAQVTVSRLPVSYMSTSVVFYGAPVAG